MIRLLLCLFLIILSFQIYSQNLVLNGSFEDVNICDEYHAPCSPSAWFFQNKTGAQGYSKEGELGAKETNRYLSLQVARANSFKRQYWETMLAGKIRAGKKYKVSFRYFDDPMYATLDEFGLYFRDSFLFTWEDSLLQPPVYVNFAGAKTKKMRNRWVSVEKEFVLTQDAQFVILGNFSTKTNLEILTARNSAEKKLYLPVDDLVIKCVEESDCVTESNLSDSLYALTRRHYEAPSMAKKEMPNPLKKPVVVDDLEPRVDTIRLTNIEFDFDQYKLKNLEILDPYKRILSRQGIQKVIVIGYTDSKGSDEYNKELSVKRSKEIAGLLTTKFHISSGLIESEGRGKSLQYQEDAKNRRVEIFVYY